MIIRESDLVVPHASTGFVQGGEELDRRAEATSDTRILGYAVTRIREVARGPRLASSTMHRFADWCAAASLGCASTAHRRKERP